MARVSDAEVKEIIDTDITTTSFITIANLMVTDELGTSGLSEARLKEIERWLAAHFVAIRDPRTISEDAGDAGVVYHRSSRIGNGLDSTPYGQQVKILDTTGTFKNMDKQVASIDVINTFDGDFE